MSAKFQWATKSYIPVAVLWIQNSKGRRRKRLWSDPSSRLGTGQEGPRKLTKHLGTDSGSVGRSLDVRPFEYKAQIYNNKRTFSSAQCFLGQLWGPSTPHLMCTGVTSWQRCEVELSPLPTAEIQNKQNFIFPPLHVFMLWCFVKHWENHISLYCMKTWGHF
jgi:hypothetical protein